MVQVDPRDLFVAISRVVENAALKVSDIRINRVFKLPWGHLVSAFLLLNRVQDMEVSVDVFGFGISLGSVEFVKSDSDKTTF